MGDRYRMDNPANQACRLFVGGIPLDTSEQNFSERFGKWGKVQHVVVLKGFGFVQYENAEAAQKAIAEESGKMFGGKMMEVKPARRSPAMMEGKRGGGGARGRGGLANTSQPRGPYGGGGGGGGGGGFDGFGSFNKDYEDQGFQGYGGGGGGNQSQAPISGPAQGERRNDCEIVCVSRFQRNYAEFIEGRLTSMGLRNDVLFPNPDIPLPKILGNIASRGVLFAVVVTPLNEEHRSMTVNILQGPQPQEHRNMPFDDAMGLVMKSFKDVAKNGSNLGRAAPIVSGNGNNDVMPNDIRTVLGFLMEKRPLSVMEYDKLIKYLAQKREGVLREEYGDNIPSELAQLPIGPPVDPATKAKQNELHDRIMNILNKPKPKPTPQQPAGGSSDTGINPSLQRAIDNLIRTGPNLLNQMNQSSSNYGGQGDSYSTYRMYD